MYLFNVHWNSIVSFFLLRSVFALKVILISQMALAVFLIPTNLLFNN